MGQPLDYLVQAPNLLEPPDPESQKVRELRVEREAEADVEGDAVREGQGLHVGFVGEKRFPEAKIACTRHD